MKKTEGSMVSKYLEYIWHEAYLNNTENILSFLHSSSTAKVLDVGCGDGEKTMLFKDKIRCQEIMGIDGVQGRLAIAKGRGVTIVYGNLEKRWQLPTKYFDVVVSNQVIEHVVDVDHFIAEIYRILKPKGYCVISTENLSSWHNIIALVLGVQDFSHHILKRKHVSNPFSIHYGEKTATWSAKGNSGVDDAAYPHVKILTYRSLIRICEEYGFIFEQGKGSGYYPLWGTMGRIASRIDPYHSHFITVKMRK